MTSSDNIRLVGTYSDATREKLREVLYRCYSTFQVYSRCFENAGISKQDISVTDPLKILQKLPLMDLDTFDDLTDESLRIGRNIIDMETSSGTTGRRKRRFISYQDDIAETKFLAELFKTCGIGKSDRVACLDTDPLTLMVSFTKALDLLGVEESYAFCVGNDYRRMLEKLPVLDPTVIIAVPSLIERCYESLLEFYKASPFSNPKKLVYVGEPLSISTRNNLESDFGVEIFGYYGASETSALGVECTAHDGTHLFTDHNIIEAISENGDSCTGEIIVTTLNQETLSLLRYPLRDEIFIKSGTCSCGREYPRVDVLGRFGDSVSVLGAKISYNAIRKAIYENGEDDGPMQMVLTRDAQERLTINLPKALSDQEIQLRRSLMKSQPDLDFLTGSKYMSLDFAFLEDKAFQTGRKQTRIIDLRESREPSITSTTR